MRFASLGRQFALSLAVAAWLGPGPAAAGEDASPPGGLVAASDPCGFYRGQAYGRGLMHYATEMLWACETIQARHAAEMSLSARLLAAEAALERYRTAVIATGAAVFARERAARPGQMRLGAGEEAKAALAESTGTLAALEAIRAGF